MKTKGSSAVREAAPAFVFGKVPPPRRRPNAELRPREYLTPDEVERLMAAARRVGRHGHRDSTLILLMYRHGLRVSELIDLEWSDLDFTAGTLHVRRRKKGRDSVHPLRGVELRALRRLRRENPEGVHVFMSERKSPLDSRTVRHIVARAGEEAGLPLRVHPHMLRHACGYKLGNGGHGTRAIQVYMGHANIQHTARYTEVAVARFRDFFRD